MRRAETRILDLARTARVRARTRVSWSMDSSAWAIVSRALVVEVDAALSKKVRR